MLALAQSLYMSSSSSIKTPQSASFAAAPLPPGPAAPFTTRRRADRPRLSQPQAGSGTWQSALNLASLLDPTTDSAPPLVRTAMSEEEAAQHALKDAYAAAVLSEVVYKGFDIGQEKSELAVRKLEALLPITLNLGSLAWSPPGQQKQPYVVSETEDAVYVAFLGTKRPLDIVENFNYGGTSSYLPILGDEAKVHRGYVARATAAPAAQLWQLAMSRGKVLVLCGHSLGGAVATLCTLRLLSELPSHLHHTVRAVGFATPPLGNAEVATSVAELGWHGHLKNYLLPEDWVPAAMTLWRKSSFAADYVGAATDPPPRATRAVITRTSSKSGQPGSKTESVSRRMVLLGWMAATMGVLSAAAGVAAAKASSAATMAADLILGVPRRYWAPRYVHIGRNVYLNRRVSVDSREIAAAASALPAKVQAHDPLVPMQLKATPLASHRMVAYRLRIIESPNTFSI